MNVKVYKNPKAKEGLVVSWNLTQNYREEVDLVKRCLGLSFKKEDKTWISSGPEILLDMHRFGIGIEWASAEALKIAQDFRQQIWETMDCRALPIDDELYAYQKHGTQFLSLMPSAILADDLGVGKTKQALDAAVKIGANRILVLAPKTLTYNWKAEVEKWHPDMTAIVIPDSKKERDTFWQDFVPDITIANYEKLQSQDWPSSKKWDVLICDEASRFKNSTTITYKKVKQVRGHSRYAWALTGTPLEIKVEELYNILSLLRPAVLGGFYRFRDEHLITDWAGSVTGIKQLELLRERIAPYILRRTKAEVLKQLPEKVTQNVYVKMSIGEQAAYQAMTSAFGNWLDEHGVSGAGNAMTEMLRMRQFCCTPAIFTDELGIGSKAEAIKEIIYEWQGKVLVFCFFKEAIDKYHKWLGCHPDAIISGNVAAEERLARINEFNAGKLGKVLVSTDAGNQGLNITGANLLIHVDQLFNPQKQEQREGRLHRIGQTDNVTIMNVMMLDSIDYGIFQIGEERRKLFDDVVNGTELSLLKKLSAPRLKALVEGRSISGGE